MDLDPTQSSQMLKFLDEERQKDKALLAALQERVESQAQQLARQEEQLSQLQGAVASVEALLSQATEFTQTVEQFKNEVVEIIDQREEKQRKEWRELERTYNLDIGAIKDDVVLIEDMVKRLRLEDTIVTLQAEDQRLNDAIQKLDTNFSDLTNRIEDRIQTLTYLEEQRRADNRRIATLEGDAIEVRKKAEASGSKLLLLESVIQKERSRIDTGLTELKEFEKLAEQMRVDEFRRQQHVKRWDTMAEELKAELELLKEERQRILQQFQQSKRAHENLEDFKARLETRQNEVAEMQRVAEDRAKRQWEEWQAAAEKTHRSREMPFEEAQKRQDRTNQDHADQIKQLERQMVAVRESITSICSSLEDEGRTWVEALQTNMEEMQRIAQTTKEP